VCWSGCVWWGVGDGEQAVEGISVWPVERQVQGDAAGSSGDPGGHGDQVAAQRAGPGFGVKQAGQAPSGAGEVMGDGGQCQPGCVRGKGSLGYLEPFSDCL